jgi:hypothetical protein
MVGAVMISGCYCTEKIKIKIPYIKVGNRRNVKIIKNPVTK